MEFLSNIHQLNDLALVVLRLGVATSFLIHGSQKWAMWHAQPSGQPPARMLSILRLLSIVEPLGGAALVTGFLTQFAAAGFAIIMIGAIRLKVIQMHKKFGEPGGWELDLMLLAGAIALFFTGAGQFALDRILFGF